MNRLHDQIQKTIIRELSNVHTTLIARITKVNRAEGTIACQPVINRVAKGEAIELPEFPDVPVITLQGGKHYISFPVLEDDYCLLFVSERCFDNWYEGSDNLEPADHRMFDYSDSFALVGVNPRAKVLPISEDNEILIISENGDHIRLVDEDRIDLITKGDVNVKAEGDVNIDAGGDININAKGNVNIKVDGDTTLESNKVDIKSGTINIGNGALEKMMKGETFMQIFNTHNHIGNLGAPTGVPIKPMAPVDLSSVVKNS